MNSLPIAGQTISADPGYPQLKEYLIANTGLSYYSDKDEQLAGHVAKRLTELELTDCASYLRLLESDKVDGSELDKLIATLTIGETFFFRHREAFDALRDVVFPDLIRRNQAIRKLRIWSAGCSIGAEPYSIAILLLRDLRHLLTGWEISIVATDINRDFLDRARAGKYEEWAFRTVPDEIRTDCFSKTGSSWTIDPRYKESITFQYHNLVKDPCPSLRNHLDSFDLILCRNVTIYFSQETVRNLVQEMYFNLPENGWLLVGHAEPNVDVYRSFRAVNLPGAVLYQKTTGEPNSTGWVQSPAFSFLPQPITLPQAITVPPIPAWAPETAPTFARQNSELSEANGDRAPIPSFAACSPLDSIRQIADEGDLENAARSYETLIEREKLNPVAHFCYALVLEQMGRRQETQDSLRRAIYLDRNFIVAHYYLGLIQQKMAEPKQALRCFRNVVGLLAGLRPEQRIPAADEFTVAELRQLVQMHMDALPKV